MFQGVFICTKNLTLTLLDAKQVKLGFQMDFPCSIYKTVICFDNDMPLMRFQESLLNIPSECLHHVNLKEKSRDIVLFWERGVVCFRQDPII